MSKRLSLGKKITSLLIALVLISGSLIGFIAIREQTSAIESNLVYTAKELSSSLSEKIGSYISHNTAVLETIGVTNDITSYNKWEQKSLLRRVNEQNKDFTLLFVTDSKGQQVARSDDQEFSDNSDRDYFKEAISKKKTVISDVLVAKTTGKPSVVIAVPIFSEQGEFKGIVGGTLSLAGLEEMRNKIKIGQTGYAFITDSRGQVLAHAEEKLVNERTNISDIGIVKKALNGETGAETYDYNGEKVCGSYTMVSNTGWTVVVTQTYDDAFSSVTTAQKKMLGVLITILAISIIIGIRISRSLVKPLLTLKNAAKELAEGNLTYEFKVETTDEIGEVADSFIDMRESLKNLVGKIISASNDVTKSSKDVLDSTKEAEIVAGQIAEATCQLALGCEEQIKSVENTFEEINKIVQAVLLIWSNSTSSLDSSKNAEVLVQNGVQIVNEQNITMQESTHAVKQVSEIIFTLKEKTSEIEKIVDSIESVAEQTNLKESIAKIQNIIQSIQSTTSTAVNSVNNATNAISKQNESVGNTSKIFKDILEVVNKMGTDINNISKKTLGMDGAGESILQDMERILAVTQETAASTEEVTASTEEQAAFSETIVMESEKLNKLAEELKKYTSRFKI